MERPGEDQRDAELRGEAKGEGSSTALGLEAPVSAFVVPGPPLSSKEPPQALENHRACERDEEYAEKGKREFVHSLHARSIAWQPSHGKGLFSNPSESQSPVRTSSSSSPGSAGRADIPRTMPPTT